ncbi:MAG: pyruvate kinase [Bryobacterales bacterium]|nr:pyruvate kinase [Bryobacterales bacterium]
MRQTKIVATLGPATDNSEIIEEMITAGVNVFRFNASHGTHAEHVRRLNLVRQVAGDIGRSIACLLDLQGPKIRLGKFANTTETLEEGDEFTITVEEVLGSRSRASTNFTNLVNDVGPGERILLNDGAVELRVTDVTGPDVRCKVVKGGEVGDNKGINLPNIAVSAPSLTEKDLDDLTFAVENGFDFVALSFVRSPDDVRELRDELRKRDSRIPIISKIEKPQAWDNLEGILTETDGVMVARGDLGVEMDLARVPHIQKSIIERARWHNRFVITATQMLESMVESATPTRAEVSDVANAIFDGTDAVMLSAETSVGKFPIDAVRMMAKIALEVESSSRFDLLRKPPPRPNPSYAEIIADMAYHAGRAARTQAIVVFTSSGHTARLVARYRPSEPIYAFSHSEETARCLAPVFGVHPILVQRAGTTDEMLPLMERTLMERDLVEKGDGVVFVAAHPIRRPGSTNLLKLHRIGDGE